MRSIREGRGRASACPAGGVDGLGCSCRSAVVDAGDRWLCSAAWVAPAGFRGRLTAGRSLGGSSSGGAALRVGFCAPIFRPLFEGGVSGCLCAGWIRAVFDAGAREWLVGACTFGRLRGSGPSGRSRVSRAEVGSVQFGRAGFGRPGRCRRRGGIDLLIFSAWRCWTGRRVVCALTPLNRPTRGGWLLLTWDSADFQWTYCCYLSLSRRLYFGLAQGCLPEPRAKCQ